MDTKLYDMSEIKYIGTPKMIAEISDQIDYLVKWEHWDLLDAVLMALRPEECDGAINYCIVMKCLSHRDKLVHFKLFLKRVEQALKNQNQMSLVAAIQNVNI